MKHPVLSLAVLAVALLILCAAASSAVIYVKYDSPGPTFDGTSWDKAFHTVQAGLSAATSGGEVRVARGTYVERITLKAGVALYGGYSGAGDTRNIATYPAILDGNQGGSVVRSPSGATSTTRIDGFTIRKGRASSNGGGIYCSSSSPTITNNTIAGNEATGGGGGIYCYSWSPAIANNTITGNYASDGGGIFCESSGATITNNLIARNYASSGVGEGDGGGIFCKSSSSSVISNNTIRENFAPYGGAICCTSSSPAIMANLIAENSATKGGGIYCSDPASSPTIANNTLRGNRATSNGGGLHCSSAPVITNNTVIGNSAASGGGGAYLGVWSPAVSNNLVAFNSSGIDCSHSGTPVLRNNCVYGNTAYNYHDLSEGVGDISVDPLLAGAEYGNMHIQAGSPCLNAGWNGAPGLPETDMDGQPRIHAGTVDIGADESDATVWSPGPYVIVRVSPSGNDANDGSSWALAKKTVQAGIEAASALGGEVWVKAGTYNERIVLQTYAYVYGGFGGMENSRAERNWTANKSILDGGASGSVVIARVGQQVSAIDGFTIRNGYAHSGGGVYCSVSSPTIANNVIGGNTAYYAGGAIYCAGASPTITNNRIMWNSAMGGGGIFCDFSAAPTITNNAISGNTASLHGGGVSCESSSTPTITNNTILVNTASMSGGGLYSSYSSPKVSNNIIAFNSSGIYRDGWTPTLHSNCVFGNHGYDYSGISAGTDDISADPLIVDWGSGDHHLMPLSPCINAGWNEAPGLPLFDMDGDGRVFGRKVDIGADEFWSPEMSISDTRYAADGAKISGQGTIVTAAFSDCFYIEAEDRSSGIRVEKSDHGVQTGDRADVTGMLKTNDDGERYIEASSVSLSGTGSIAPVRVTGRTLGGGNWFYNPATGAGQQGVLGGAGLNNIGLLVRTWGKVTHVGDGFFYFDDGSNLREGSGFAGVKALVAGPGLPAEGDYIRSTGISSCFRDGENLHRLLRVQEWSKEQSATPIP